MQKKQVTTLAAQRPLRAKPPEEQDSELKRMQAWQKPPVPQISKLALPAIQNVGQALGQLVSNPPISAPAQTAWGAGFDFQHVAPQLPPVQQNAGRFGPLTAASPIVPNATLPIPLSSLAVGFQQGLGLNPEKSAFRSFFQAEHPNQPQSDYDKAWGKLQNPFLPGMSSFSAWRDREMQSRPTVTPGTPAYAGWRQQETQDYTPMTPGTPQYESWRDRERADNPPATGYGQSIGQTWQEMEKQRRREYPEDYAIEDYLKWMRGQGAANG